VSADPQRPGRPRSAPSIEQAIFADVQPDAARRLLLAGHDVFARKGYHAATTREIAAGAQLSPAAMYIHYRSKQDLLFHLSLLGHESCEQAIISALRSAEGPAGRLAAVSGAFAGWHAAHHTTARIVHHELDALSRDNFDGVAAVRRRIDRVFLELVRDGVAAGSFEVEELAGTALAITSMCVDVARWFPAGPLHSPDDVERLYADLALRIVRSALPSGN
jgi:AcrR family transcriptional regulator